jgi:hypothetical protein
MSVQAFVSEFLTFLEKREERLLSWGFYNVRWTIPEVEDAFASEAPTDLQDRWNALASQGLNIPSLLLQMRQRNLIYQVPNSESSYRTRFAEGVRLLGNLRQMFKADDWATGPRLVSDIKLKITPRLYPRRDQSAESVWVRLQPLCPPGHADLMRHCFFALTAQKDGGSFSFSGFQVRAFEHILKSYGSSGFSGSVVCAGTGSGKTKAFYVPAFLRIAPTLNQPAYPKIIAIYPRNVLLADQLREAISEAEKLRPLLVERGLRPIRFGALLGDTPYSHYFSDPNPKHYHWSRRGSGTVIPYLKSPSDGGQSALIWRDADRASGQTCLYREGAAQPDVPHGVLAITREELQTDPPDVLFLSLEMLNRELCNPAWAKTFGLNQSLEKSPRLLLLDEVHAHEGLSGAQVAWVLRRWRHWARLKSLHVVGLSATLRDAPQHLARVASLNPASVQEFRPRPGLGVDGEMEAEGGEYHLAVKGDPAAGASLLGTSIQVGMLLARLLTPRTQGPSGSAVQIRPEEFYRKKVFGFSDNLDSVNRWFSDMSDAESASPRHPLLASLRQLPTPGTPEAIRRRRFDEGQVWEIARLIGHNLDNPLTVTRCSSQDPGADMNSDLIIATSSLEVGFDDPEVGAMLHHKRPGSMSSFIQRKGRAGRTRGSRPWTVVVLSDYGADRWAFHSAEQLFQPEVDSLVLPTLNPYVLRVQLAHYLIDWIGRRLGGNTTAFRYLQGPSNFGPEQNLQAKARELLRGLLDQGSTWNQFQRELQQFFRFSTGLNNDEDANRLLDNLLWYEPRPLIMQVVPTLLRKLESNWSYSYPPAIGAIEDKGAGRPLPQFIPKATFTDLEIGEAVVELQSFRNIQRQPQSMEISRLLFESCPGRVSKRFATAQGEPGYWLERSATLQVGSNTASIADLFPQNTFLEAVTGVSIFQPEAANLVHRPNEVSDTSNAQWIWQTLARVQGEGELLPVRELLPWRDVFSEAEAFLHSNAAWIEVLRYSEESHFETRRNQQSVSGSLRLQSAAADGATERQAVGFRLRADGVRFVLSGSHLSTHPALSVAMLQRFRADYFKHVVVQSPVLRALVNSFQAEWLSDMSLAMLTATALTRRCSLAEAQAHLNGLRPQSASRVLDVIFQLRGVNVAGTATDAKLRTTLLDFWSNPDVRDAIIALECVLWAAPDEAFASWLHQRYAATLAQALRMAMVSLAPQVNEDELALDVLPRPEGGFELTITETSPGGVGQIETIVREMQRQPRRFLDGLEFALNHCEREASAQNLLATVDAGCNDSSPIHTAFSQAREASGFTALEEAREQLRSALHTQGFSASRKLIVSVVTKLLRPGSNNLSDRLTRLLNQDWQRRSQRLGIAIPVRTAAYTFARHPVLGSFLRRYFESFGGEQPTDPQLFAQLQQLLLESCSDSCPECLNQRGRYYDLGLPSRALARDWLGIEMPEILIDANPNNWLEEARAVLRNQGRVRLVATSTQKAALSQALPQLTVAELELESLRVSVSVARIEHAADRTTVVLHIPDFVNG